MGLTVKVLSPDWVQLQQQLSEPMCDVYICSAEVFAASKAHSDVFNGFCNTRTANLSAKHPKCVFVIDEIHFVDIRDADFCTAYGALGVLLASQPCIPAVSVCLLLVCLTPYHIRAVSFFVS